MRKISPFIVVLFFFLGCKQVVDKVQESQKYTNTNYHEVVDLVKKQFADTLKAKNVVLMIGDGTGFPQLYSGMIANKGKLNVFKCPQLGTSKTNSDSDLVTDSAAGATALATGKKTTNKFVGVGPQGGPLETILDIAMKNNKATGLVATCNLTHATPASFAAHRDSRSKTVEIAHDMAVTAPDLMIGGGRKDFGQSFEGKNTMEILAGNGVSVYNSLEEASNHKEGKMAVLVADDHPDPMSKGRGDYLVNAVELALNTLSQRDSGFFLMVEGSQIDWGGHNNDLAYVVQEVLDFDRAIGKVLEFAQENGETLVIITADHETGGLGIIGGDIATATLEARFNTTNHTAHLVPVFAYGPRSEQFNGQFENISIFDKMMTAYGFENGQK